MYKSVLLQSHAYIEVLQLMHIYKNVIVEHSDKDSIAGTSTYHKKDTKTRIQAVKAEKH